MFFALFSEPRVRLQNLQTKPYPALKIVSIDLVMPQCYSFTIKIS